MALGQAYGQDLRDRVLACPEMTLAQAAARFSVSPSYVSKVRARLRVLGDAAPAPQHNHVPARLAPLHEALREHMAATPDTSASWLNMVEGQFALLSRRQLQRGDFKSTDELEGAIHADIDRTNADPEPFTWIRPTDAIRASISRFCQRTSASHRQAGVGCLANAWELCFLSAA